jgi:general secretion pathway protein M
MNALLAWYRGREPREQRVLLFGAIAAPLIMLVFGLVALQRQVQAAETRVVGKRQDVAWLQMVVPQLQAQQQRLGGQAGRGNESLVVLTDRVARESGVTLSSSEPGGNGALRVRADKAAFDSLALWLGQLTQRYGVSIDSASIDAADADGVVNASLVLRGR